MAGYAWRRISRRHDPCGQMWRVAFSTWQHHLEPETDTQVDTLHIAAMAAIEETITIENFELQLPKYDANASGLHALVDIGR